MQIERIDNFRKFADDLPLSDAERGLCVAQGRRLAETALQLRHGK